VTALPVAWRVRAAAAALVLPAAIRVMSLARLMTWITPDSPKPRHTVRLDDTALARWVSRILAHLPGPWHLSCLNRSVVLYQLLRAAGRPVELCIGVTRVPRRPSGAGDSGISAHAWLMLDGAPYLEADNRPTNLPIVARFPDALAHYG
jgi:hypothetical protein